MRIYIILLRNFVKLFSLFYLQNVLTLFLAFMVSHGLIVSTSEDLELKLTHFPFRPVMYV